MGLQAIDAAPKDGSPGFAVDQDSGDKTTAHWVVRQGVWLQRQSASIAFSQVRWLTGSKTVEGSRERSRVLTRASVSVGVCGLWLFIGALGDNGLCGESDTRSLVSATGKGQKIAQTNVMRDEYLLVSQVVETAAEQKQIERGREKIDIFRNRLTLAQRLDATQGKAAQALQPAPAAAGALHAHEAEIEEMEAQQQERGRAESLTGEVTARRAELDAARIVGSEAVQAREAEIKQKQGLERERGRADALAREFTSLRA